MSDIIDREKSRRRAASKAKIEAEVFRDYDASSPLWAGRSWALKVKALFASHGPEFERGFREAYDEQA